MNELPTVSPSPGGGRKPRADSKSRRVVVFAAALVGAVLAARLGFWQLDRAAQKEALQAAIVDRGSEPAIPAQALARKPAGVAAQFDRRVRLSGHWINEKTVFLDNRQMQGRVGFFVVTPLRLDGSPDVVLVERGWAPRNFTDRKSLPAIPRPTGDVEVEGRIAAAPSRLFQFNDAASGVIRQNIDPSSYSLETGLPLLPLSIIESPTAGNAHDGLTRSWPAPAIDVQMNYGYAFQWFAIGAVIVFLYIRFAIFRPRHRRDE